MDAMTSFSYIYIVTICVGLLSAEAEITVSGQVGSTPVLPCELQSVGTETPHIRWITEYETVFERFGEESYQGEGYEDRVDVPEEELHKRSCFLVLHNLSLTDAGVCTSYQTVRRSKSSASVKTKRDLISRVNLSVQGNFHTLLQTVSGHHDLLCFHLHRIMDHVCQPPLCRS
ncbi:uncharacterized protein LOC117598107 isoform X2 [Pangasianodon hypophthalmus]|uniref:uncharacterized protein LOC113523823 isoform X2 n=1 Tax=Pangasianodon hypophthalmus TaxID=310915 RepID=UPI002306E150|nr:uncharacterized protein LOC113523823 isoform X2 [Pangasianodon hypophthalmus]XP_053092721.1 uncharacterized protein LOC117598107 isoform X2 [Pangasianodon hypophthalmus]XP_053092722.1 uncharacterized protein LOC117598107 isoform X2 [Pangasianodon hypophthalmus]